MGSSKTKRISVRNNSNDHTQKDVEKGKVKKIKYLRHNEYYDTQEIFDNLYYLSKKKAKFKNLFNLVMDERNLMLAIRNIKDNKGSKTNGINKHTIDFWLDKDQNEYIKYMVDRLYNYIPHKVRRVEIPKDNGKTRPLGIPTIEDRLIQQAIKQILEPIVEAKFYKHSYGFRPNRSAKHAIAYFMKKVNREKCYYIVNVDIKSFFDNVDHGKLLKQLWTLGIRDKQILSIISKMLKAEIAGIGIPTKGTPQGGILSPLLANVVLNELDYWIANQWENMKTTHQYSIATKNGNSTKYTALRKTKLKEIYIVRYADDFKILCKSYNTALKIFNATKKWLKERLNLEMSEEKSGISNIKRKHVDFLGISLKADLKKKKYVIQSQISIKSKDKIKNNLKIAILMLQKHPTAKSVDYYNMVILGIQNYYKMATLVNLDLVEIEYMLSKKLKNRIKGIESKTGMINKVYLKFYARYKGKKHYIADKVLFPLSHIKTKPPLLCNQKICNYTEEGRGLIHGKIAYINPRILKYLMTNPAPYKSTLFNDNRLSLYAGQQGLCGITKEPLMIGHMEIHHIKPTSLYNGIPNDKYKNLIFITDKIHEIIHKIYPIEYCSINNEYEEVTILHCGKEFEYLYELTDVALERLNKYRLLTGNVKILIKGRNY